LQTSLTKTHKIPDYKPMLCKDGSADDLERLQGIYVAELKLDGTRVISYSFNGQVKLINRRGIDYSKRLPEITKALRELEDNCILDGEIVAYDENGRTIFTLAQRRCATTTPKTIWKLMKEIPVYFVVWDILNFEGKDLTRKPYSFRKQVLKEVIDWNSHKVLYLPYQKNLKEAYQEAVNRGEEGLILKQLTSPYCSGDRNTHWLKVKRFHFEIVDVIGYTEGNNKYNGLMGALVLEQDNKYCGKCGSGFTDHDRQSLTKILKICETDTRRHDIGEPYTPIESDLKVRVRFYERTDDGLFRFPSFQGIVEDEG